MNAVPAPRRDLVVSPTRTIAARQVEAPERQTRISLWLPTTAVFVLLAPFALLLLPFLYFAPRDVIPRPAATLAMLGAVLLSLGGTHVEIDAPDARIRLHLF